MPNREQNGNLPTLAQWQARYRYALTALMRGSARFRDLTLAKAPANLNTPHIDYMLRPSFVRQLSEIVTAISVGVYQVEVHARYRMHRPQDRQDLTIARQNLTAAATALHRIAERSRGDR